MSRSVVGLHKLILKIEDYCSHEDLIISLVKSKVLIFSKRKRTKIFRWPIACQQMEQVNQFKYLVIHPDTSLSWKPHLDLARINALRIGRTIVKYYYIAESEFVPLAIKVYNAKVTNQYLHGVESRSRTSISGHLNLAHFFRLLS